MHECQASATSATGRRVRAPSTPGKFHRLSLAPNASTPSVAERAAAFEQHIRRIESETTTPSTGGKKQRSLRSHEKISEELGGEEIESETKESVAEADPSPTPPATAVADDTSFIPKSEAAPQPEPEPEPIPELQPEPAPEPEPKSEPTPVPEPAPEAPVPSDLVSIPPAPVLTKLRSSSVSNKPLEPSLRSKLFRIATLKTRRPAKQLPSTSETQDTPSSKSPVPWNTSTGFVRSTLALVTCASDGQKTSTGNDSIKRPSSSPAQQARVPKLQDAEESFTSIDSFQSRFVVKPQPFTLTQTRPQPLDYKMAGNNNPDTGVAMPQLEDLLRHPEDLEKIPALKAEYTRKKAAVDAQLRENLRDQLETVQRGIAVLAEGQRHVSKTRDELQGIDKLCAESQTTVGDFSQIDRLARIQRNFEATMMMKRGLETFDHDLAEVGKLLREDDEDPENLPNLLGAHMAITRLRDFRDEAMDQIRKAKDNSSEATLVEWFQGLDSTIEWFDEHLGTACMNLIPLVQSGNHSMVVRLAVVVMNEEKNDEKVKALQEAQKDHKDLASRFKSMNIGPKTVRGYKENFLKSIELYAQAQFESTRDAFLDDPDKLEKNLKWFFNDLFTVKKGMQALVPKKWKIFQTYTNTYHTLMHDWLISFVDDPELPAANMLSIIHWVEKYYTKMEKLGWKRSDLVPNVIDDRESELVRDWRNLIIKALDEWMDRMFATDKKAFLERTPDTLDTNADGYFRTKTLGDMWRMIHEQINAAGSSERTDVTEGVIDAMFRSLKSRQAMWQAMVDDECAKYKSPAYENAEGLQVLQDWLIAVANDQIACIDDNEELNQLGYLTRFRRDFEPLVTPEYMASRADPELDTLRDGYVDLSTHCLALFVDLVFSIDFKTTLPDFFTPKWYSEFAIKRITSTFDDYMSDYSTVLHPSLADILVEELSDELLVRYLSSIRNKGVKFRRQDPFTDKFKDDVLTVFAFFQKFPDAFAGTIKQKWRLVDWLVRLLEADKSSGGVVAVYEGFKTEYWDLQLSWVEAVLRSRDDFERSMVSAVKAKAAELYVERGMETTMGKVR
ncbi:SNARE-binding exocyst subunit S6 [Arachnomyces sp. PD_36]|nr:SNARE-binding exocyst subunit S6 [Arachnomyces sp. PD_36]